MSLGTEVGLGPRGIVLHGNPAPPKMGTAPSPFLGPCVYCVQTAGYLKMPLVIDLVPGHVVLDGDPAPFVRGRKGHRSSPLFGPCLLWPNR